MMLDRVNYVVLDLNDYEAMQQEVRELKQRIKQYESLIEVEYKEFMDKPQVTFQGLIFKPLVQERLEKMGLTDKFVIRDEEYWWRDGLYVVEPIKQPEDEQEQEAEEDK